jgi:TonB-linked SusC/RagA family outer membrane protein
MVGYNYEESTTKGLTAQRNGLIYENANDLNLALGQSIQTGGGWQKWITVGGFYRFNYSFKDKYLVELNGRYDGSSRFPSNQRYGFFPSVSAGWRVSNESFWNVSDKIISDLKLRGSYGSLGNGNIAPYSYLELLSVSQSDRILGGIRPPFTSRPSVLPLGLTWETSTTKNLGLDFAMISHRLNVSADVYERKTTDMYTPGVTLPAVFGATSPRGNFADLRTRGWEVSVAWNDAFKLASKAFKYDVRVTLSDNSAVITKFNNPNKLLSDYYVGQKIGEIWGYETEGFFSTAEEVANHASQLQAFSNSNGKSAIGDIMLRDLNGDKAVNAGSSTVNDPGDRRIIGNSAARYTYGITLGGEWNNIFFSAFFQGVGKQDWWPSTEAGVFWGQYNRPYNKLPRWHLDNHWTPDNPNAYLPRYVSRLANRSGGVLREAQTKYLQNVAYIRLKNFQLGYNLPAKIISKIHSTGARVYFSGENMWAWSPLYRLTRDIDVESTGPSDQVFTDSNAGDAYNYPMMKGLTFGLSITF